VVNLYPFAKAISKPNCSFEEAIENIDIGGPSMIRSGAKNFRSVAVVVNPARYAPLLAEMQANAGQVLDATLEQLVVEAFAHTADFDRTIHAYLQHQLQGQQELPGVLNLHFERVQDLRYGENPHHKAAFYRQQPLTEPCVAAAKQLHGKELSYNNIADMDAALELVKEFSDPAVVIIKHANPCGCATAPNLGIDEAYRLAYEGDPLSAYGGITAANRPVNLAMAQHIGDVFMECVVAPSFEAGALEFLKKKKNLRLLELPGLGISLATTATPLAPGQGAEGFAMKKVTGGMLVQDRDLKRVERAACKVVSRRQPTEQEWADMLFAWRVCAHVKSNAIVIAKAGQTLGVGPGQTNRVGSVKIASEGAGAKAQGAALASDAFFPFRDGVDAAAKAGVKSIIQPGGSTRDAEAIAAADEAGMAMVFTGMRHFYH
jgi:phosphoribosylaminoimidazolecarboxamide formyltransferase/IMP cyclohydrolase